MSTEIKNTLIAIAIMLPIIAFGVWMGLQLEKTIF